MEIMMLDTYEFEGQQFELQYEKEEADTLIGVYTCKDFFGYPVTIAEKLVLDMPEESLILKYTFRAAVCGQGDPYSEATGINIALGRIQQADDCDIILAGTLEHGESVANLSKNFSEVKLQRLKEYVEAKKDVEGVMEQQKQMNHKILGRKFEEFK